MINQDWQTNKTANNEQHNPNEKPNPHACAPEG